jgi:large subunit ribosomal protein L15
MRAMQQGWMYGKHGFHRPPAVRTYVTSLNIGELDEMAPYLVEAGVAEDKNGVITINLSALGFDKLLGNGRTTKKYMINVGTASATAKAKVEEQGGQIISETETA